MMNQQVASGLECYVKTIDETMRTLDFSSESILRTSGSAFWPTAVLSLSHKTPPFGRGIAVSSDVGRTVMSDSRTANPILRDVATSVLNGSQFLDFHVDSHHHGGPVAGERFFFVKTNKARLGDDLEQLQRISGIFNVTVEQTKTGSEVR